MSTKFDILAERYIKKSRTRTKKERRPKIELSESFVKALEDEYCRNYSDSNRNYYNNFLKLLSFELDDIKDDPTIKNRCSEMELEIDSKYDDDDESEPAD